MQKIFDKLEHSVCVTGWETRTAFRLMLLLGALFSAHAQDAEVDAPILPSSPIAAPEIGRYQFEIIQRDNANTQLYIMDTATGTILRNTGNWDATWELLMPALSPVLFEDAIAKHSRDLATMNLRKEKFPMERQHMWGLFHDGTLEQQVNAAESILVLKCVARTQATPSRTVSPLPIGSSRVVSPSRVATVPVKKDLQVTAVLKGSDVSSVQQETRSKSGGDFWWKLKVAPYQYPQVDEILKDRIINGHTAFEFIDSMDEGEIVVLFTVSSAETCHHYEFYFVSDRVDVPEQLKEYDIFLTREPSELIADIKAILERKEW